MPYDDLRKGRRSEAKRAYFVTTVLKDRNRPFFTDLYCARLVILQLRHLHEADDVTSLAWVVMPDHVHWLFQLMDRKSLAQVMKQFKASSSCSVNQYLKREGALWQKAYYDHALRDSEDIRGIARYIVANPLRSGLVDHIACYPHWDAIWM